MTWPQTDVCVKVIIPCDCPSPWQGLIHGGLTISTLRLTRPLRVTLEFTVFSEVQGPSRPNRGKDPTSTSDVGTGSMSCGRGGGT